MWKWVGLLAVVVLSGCASADGTQPAAFPVPEGAQSVEELDRGYDVVQVTFETGDGYPSTRVRDFYSSWAKDQGWRTVTNEEDQWVNDQWVSFLVPAGDEDEMIHQMAAHWKSPDDETSLLLALRYQGSLEKQYGYVLFGPSDLLDLNAEY